MVIAALLIGPKFVLTTKNSNFVNSLENDLENLSYLEDEINPQYIDSDVDLICS